MGMNSKRLAKALVDAAMELTRGDVQERLMEVDAVAFELPNEEALVYGFLTGRGTQHFTLTLLRGEQALGLMQHLIEEGYGSLMERRDASFLTFGMLRMKELNPEYRRILDRADYPPSRFAPGFMATNPGEKGRPPRREEIETLLAAILGLQEAAHADRLEGSWELGILSCVRVRGDLRRPEIQIGLVDAATGKEVDRAALQAHPDYVDPQALPDADDRSRWKAADRALVGKTLQICGRKALTNKKAMRQYLGEEVPVDLDTAPGSEFHICYQEWFVTWFRPHKNEPTIVERLLEKSRRPAERALLEARLRGRVSLFEYLAPLSEHAFEARDLLTGERIDIDDGGLATHCHPGVGLALNVYSVGDFHFAMPISVGFAAGRADRAMDLLSEPRTPTAEVLASAPHLLGRLWVYATELRKPQMPRLQNTDGDPLLGHKAAYQVAEPAVLETWLEEAQDLEFDDYEGQWVWLREADRTVLGKLQWIDDHLLAEFNSERRCETMQARLGEVPGLHLESVTTQEILPEARKRLPMDDRMGPGPQGSEVGSPETLALLQEVVNQKCMAWLDESIPMLDGKSPRESCATERGRKQVRHLILTYPDPGGVADLTVPREAMLAELGLSRA